MHIIVCGGRKFNDKQFVYETLDRLQRERGPFTLVRHGDATGADYLAFCWARDRGIEWRLFVAHWDKHSKAAGPQRNERMLKWHSLPKLVIAFPGGSGTTDMCTRAQAARVEVITVAPSKERPGSLIQLAEKTQSRSKKDELNEQGSKFFSRMREHKAAVGR